MSTMNEIVDSVLAEVYGYTATIDPTTFLTTAVSSTALTFEVSDAGRFSRGLVQIDNELILIEAVDRSNNTLTAGHVSARGVRGTSAVSHSVGALVTMAPSIPRVQAIRAVEQTLNSSTGLFAIGSYTFEYEAAVYGYALPSDVGTVLSVTWMSVGSENVPIRLRRWTHDKHNGMLVLGEAPRPTVDVTVSYAKKPTVPALSAQFTDSGLPSSCEDVIRFGAAWRIVSFIEPHNLLSKTAEADAMDTSQQQQPASRLRIAQYLFQMYRQRLDEEVADLQSDYPITVHYGGVYA